MVENSVGLTTPETDTLSSKEILALYMGIPAILEARACMAFQQDEYTTVLELGHTSNRFRKKIISSCILDRSTVWTTSFVTIGSQDSVNGAMFPNGTG